MKDEDYMMHALVESAIGLAEGNWPIGCVIELDGKIISKAHNLVYSTNDRMAHAETLALRQVQNILYDNKKQATLYTTYEPCPMCFGAAVLSRIKRVVCGIDLDKSGSMYFKDHLPNVFKTDKFNIEFKTGVLADECAKIFLVSPLTKKLNLDGTKIKSHKEEDYFGSVGGWGQSDHFFA